MVSAGRERTGAVRAQNETRFVMEMPDITFYTFVLRLNFKAGRFEIWRLGSISIVLVLPYIFHHEALSKYNAKSSKIRHNKLREKSLEA